MINEPCIPLWLSARVAGCSLRASTWRRFQQRAGKACGGHTGSRCGYSQAEGVRTRILLKSGGVGPRGFVRFQRSAGYPWCGGHRTR